MLVRFTPGGWGCQGTARRVSSRRVPPPTSVWKSGNHLFLGSRSRCNTHPIRRRCMRLPKREEKRRFWELVRAGASRAEAAVAAGAAEPSAKRWFVQAGGVLPPSVPEATSGRYLSIGEREQIFAGIERGESIRRIAKAVGRDPSTVLRQLRGNMRHQLYRSRSRLQVKPVGKPR